MRKAQSSPFTGGRQAMTLSMFGNLAEPPMALKSGYFA
jgi:hypothetical protein